jgi:hypothetical protein
MLRIASFKSWSMRRLIRGGAWRTARVLSVLLLCSQAANAAQVGATGVITSFRMYTINYPTSATHGYSAFQLEPAMANGCVWAWVDPTDKNTLAMVLSAKATGATVDINFDNLAPSPWGDASMCMLTFIALH